MDLTLQLIMLFNQVIIVSLLFLIWE